MTEYVITLLAAAAVTYILTPVVRRFAIAVGAMHAARQRDVHQMPTPLLGGFAIYGGLVAAMLVASRLSGLSSVFIETNMAKGLLLAGGLVVIMGFVDDRWGMGALSKLAGQVAAGVILVWSGAEITWLPEPGGVALILTSDQQVAVTVLVVVVTINAVNFIDGLDGLAAGVVGIGAIAFFAYYFTLIHRLGLLNQTQPALVSAILAGVCIGFLPHNFYPARIFMGDTGSMLIGLMLAYAPISSLALLDPASLTDASAYQAGTVNRYGAFIPLIVPAAILLIPYADLMMAVVRRTRAGTSVFAPDKKHLQHRLLAIGHSHRTSVLIMYLWAALFSGTVILLSIVRTPLFVLAIVTVAAVLGLLLVTMPRLRPWSRATAGDGAAGRPGLRPAGQRPSGAARATARPAVAASGAPTADVARPRAAPGRPAPARRAPAGAGPAGTAPERQAPPRSAAAGSPAPERQASARPVAAHPAGPGSPVPDRQGPARPAATRSSAQAATARTGSGATGNGSGNGAADGAGAAATAAPQDAAGPSGRARKAAEGAPPREPGPRMPLREAENAAPHRDAGLGVPPWRAENAAPSPEASRPLPPPAGRRAVPPWEASRFPREETGRTAVPPWDASRVVPPWAADRSGSPWSADHAVPPWEAALSAGEEITGPNPASPPPASPDAWGEAPDGSGDDPAAQPRPPAAPPWPPAAPPRPTPSPPRPSDAPPWS